MRPKTRAEIERDAAELERIYDEKQAERERDPSPSPEVLSLAWEAATGADSIATIERVYKRTPGGAYRCVWPDCPFSRRDPEALWRHVHSAHGRDDLPTPDFDPGPYF